MNKIKAYIFGCVVIGLVGCSTKEASYNASTYVLNKECKASNNCNGGLGSTYNENEKSTQEYQKSLSEEKELARLIKVQEELEAKEKAKEKK